jgi:hypothetical protein
MSEHEVLRYLRGDRNWELRVRIRDENARKAGLRMFGSVLLFGGLFWGLILWAVYR